MNNLLIKAQTGASSAWAFTKHNALMKVVRSIDGKQIGQFIGCAYLLALTASHATNAFNRLSRR